MGSSYCLLALTFLVLSSASLSDDPPIPVNAAINGTVAASTTLSFGVNKADLKWYTFFFGYSLEIESKPIGVKVGEAIAICEGTPAKTESSDLYNGIPLTRNSTLEICTGKTTVRIINSSDAAAHFWIMVADVDSSMYYLDGDEPIITALPGRQLNEFVTFRGYIGKETGHAGGSLDFVNITIRYDKFSKTVPRAAIVKTQRVGHYLQKPFKLLAPGLLVFQIQKSDKDWWCTECDVYFYVNTASVGSEQLFFSAEFHVDRGMITLYPGDSFEGYVSDDSHGQHIVIDSLKFWYDSNYYFGFIKTNPEECPHTLYVDVSLTSFDDGEWDVIKSTTVEGTALREWGINNNEKFFRVGGVYYMKISTAKDAISCSYSFTYLPSVVSAEWIYLGKSITAHTRNDQLGVTYYKTYIPKEDFVDVKSVTFTFTNVEYTWNKNPVFCYEFELYMGKTTNKFINNPLDKKTWSLHDTLAYSPVHEITVYEGDEGWCEDCVYGMSIVSTKLTSWTLTAHLGYVPFQIIPSTPKKGIIQPNTGGVLTEVYVYMKSVVDTHIIVNKLKTTDPDIVLYVSTEPNPSIRNYIWTEDTIGDNQALVTLRPSNPDFCNNCKYYIGIYFYEQQTEDVSNIEVLYDCDKSNCVVCSKPGQDPSQGCNTCLPGYYGPDCTVCSNCGHGKCKDGKSGDGSCVCEDGWKISDKTCSQCADGYYGAMCRICEDCGDGKCNDKQSGDGSCTCNNQNYDASIRCRDCKRGFFGKGCVAECPGGKDFACSKHGICDDGIKGNGRCECSAGFVGLECDTKYDDDKCKPHCSVAHGGCDEKKGKCVCFDGFRGNDCGTAPLNIWFIVSIVSIVIVVLILVLVILYAVTRSGRVAKKFGQKGGKNANDGKYDTVLLSSIE